MAGETNDPREGLLNLIEGSLHRLCQPLTAAVLTAEMLSLDRHPSDLQLNMMDEIRRAISVVRLARALLDRQQFYWQVQPTRLDVSLASAIHQTRSSLEERGITLSLTSLMTEQGSASQCVANQHGLTTVFALLLGYLAHHSVEGGEVSGTITRKNESVRVELAGNVSGSVAELAELAHRDLRPMEAASFDFSSTHTPEPAMANAVLCAMGGAMRMDLVRMDLVRTDTVCPEGDANRGTDGECKNIEKQKLTFVFELPLADGATPELVTALASGAVTWGSPSVTLPLNAVPLALPLPNRSV